MAEYQLSETSASKRYTHFSQLTMTEHIHWKSRYSITQHQTIIEPLRIVVVYLQKRGFKKNAIEILTCLQLIASFQQIAAQERRIPIVSNHA